MEKQNKALRELYPVFSFIGDRVLFFHLLTGNIPFHRPAR